MIYLQPLMECNDQINEPMHKIVLLKNNSNSHQLLYVRAIINFIIISFNSGTKCISDKIVELYDALTFFTNM
jgi:hemolysin-activating ACP:hemolysin acyltransferase